MKNERKDPEWKIRESTTGSTESERYLGRLAKKAFLRFWTYQNPYTDESGGQELCDLLIVFGNDIIIFSDKECEFQEDKDVKIAWQRWYKKAILKSAKQLVGAASFIKKHPNRIYLDAKCKHPLPISISQIVGYKIHLVAVTRGSAKSSEKFWGNSSSSSLVLNTKLIGSEHEKAPFMIGWPIDRKNFIHILDELTLDALLNELDTAPDFISYLNKKEQYLTTPNVDFLITGEEELLASYLLSNNGAGSFSFPRIPNGVQIVGFEEGKWKEFKESSQYKEWKDLINVSYKWDELIEHQTTHISNSTAQILRKYDPILNDAHAHERVLRAMAEEWRIGRKIISEALNDVLTRDFPGDRFSKTLCLPSRPDRAYVLLVLRRMEGQTDDDYHSLRRASLIGYCRASRLRIRGIKEVIGISTEQLDFSEASQEFAFFDCSESMTEDEKNLELQVLRDAEIWKEEWVCAY